MMRAVLVVALLLGGCEKLFGPEPPGEGEPCVFTGFFSDAGPFQVRCRGDLVCDPELEVCVGVGSPGQPCGAAGCEDGALCSVIGRVCVAPGDEDAPCVSSVECDGGLACLSGRCARPAMEGDRCHGPDDCEAGLGCVPAADGVTGTCLPPQALGGSCGIHPIDRIVIAGCEEGALCHPPSERPDPLTAEAHPCATEERCTGVVGTCVAAGSVPSWDTCLAAEECADGTCSGIDLAGSSELPGFNASGYPQFLWPGFCDPMQDCTSTMECPEGFYCDDFYDQCRPPTRTNEGARCDGESILCDVGFECTGGVCTRP